ncbi:MAG: methyltransferase domain-containing protein [Dehalococcoidia bacterium]
MRSAENRISDGRSNPAAVSDRHALVEQLFTGNAAAYNRVVTLGTLGFDRWWKRRMLRLLQPDRSYNRILDLACGTGIVTFKLAERFPGAQILGIDLMPEYLAIAERERRRRRLDCLEFRRLAAEDIGSLPGKFDLIITSYLPKYVDLARLAQDCAALAAPGGTVLFHDFTYPRHSLLRIGFRAYWGVLSLILRRIPSVREMGVELGGLIRETTWCTDLKTALQANGFANIHEEVQPLQIASIIRAERT